MTGHIATVDEVMASLEEGIAKEKREYKARNRYRLCEKCMGTKSNMMDGYPCTNCNGTGKVKT